MASCEWWNKMKCCHIRTYIVIQTYSRYILKCMFCWVTVIGLELHLLIVLFLWGILYDLEENLVLLQLKYENINIFSLIKNNNNHECEGCRKNQGPAHIEHFEDSNGITKLSILLKLCWPADKEIFEEFYS